MRTITAHEFPQEIAYVYARARRLEWITVGYIASSTAFLFFVMGSSQAMRTSFFEDAVSIVPAVAFLVCTRLARRAPTDNFPYGLHRATSIGHLIAALALSTMGLFLLIEGGLKLISQEKATIGTVTFLGHSIWAGWPMLIALLYTAVPSFFLGRMKTRLAPCLHDKILHADAAMMRADWMSETAAAAGVIGLGVGIWWLDPFAAIVVSGSIMRDGWASLRVAVTDLADRRPMKTDGSDWEYLPEEVRQTLENLDWVQQAEVRLREEGHIFMGEAFVVPKDGAARLTTLIMEAAATVKSLDWRVHDIVIMPVESLSQMKEDERSHRRETQA